MLQNNLPVLHLFYFSRFFFPWQADKPVYWHRKARLFREHVFPGCIYWLREQNHPSWTRKICSLDDTYGKGTLRMDNVNTLSELQEGQAARVASLLSAGSMRRRLQDIGLIEGTKVECLRKSPAGDPVAYFIRGAVIALRSEDSNKILVRPA